MTKNQGNSLLLLSKYQEMLLTGEISDQQTWECSELFLSGIALKELGKLKIYNLIYKKVFNSSWLEQEINKLSIPETVLGKDGKSTQDILGT